MALPSSSGEPNLLGPIDRASLYRWTTETLWLQNVETMDKVQRIDRSNTAPSSKTFRDEQVAYVIKTKPVDHLLGFKYRSDIYLIIIYV
jgi:hypothetical protein